MDRHIWYLLIGLLLAAVSGHSSNPLFDARIDYDAGDSPESVIAADLDGDGDYDLAVANGLSAHVAILRNNGDGTYETPVYYGGGGSWTYSLAIADVDGDNDSDLAVANWTANNVSILKNNGDGTFGAALSYGVGERPLALTVSDFDGDGDFDLAVTNSGYLAPDSTVSVLLNNGDGTYADTVNYDVGEKPGAITAADFDGDSDYDIAVVNLGWSNSDSTISILFNNGNGTFGAGVSYTVGEQPRSIIAADLDGDGDDDLGVTVYGNGISVLDNNGDGTFTAPVLYGTGQELAFLCASDLDGDGDYDLAATNSESDVVLILQNEGYGNFAAGHEYVVGEWPRSLFASDLDGDGDNDLAITNYYSETISLVINKGDATFLRPISCAAGNGPRSVCAADLNSDGDYDLATANQYSNSVSVMLNSGDGSLATAIHYETGQDAVALCASDLDGDGDYDLAIANEFTDNVSVLINDGAGAYTTAVNYDAGGTWPSSIVAADFDTDSDIDLAVTTSGLWSDPDSTVSILFNSGDGTYSAPINYMVGESPGCVATADLDNDGDWDLATSNAGSGDVSILINNDDGTFASPVFYELDGIPNSLCAADLDGDGAFDLAVTQQMVSGAGNVCVLKNNSDGTFVPAGMYDVGSGVLSIFAIDLDGDSDYDLAVANAASNNVSILNNNGDGSYTAAGNYGVGDCPRSITAADLDADGDNDLVVASLTTDSVFILMNRTIITDVGDEIAERMLPNHFYLSQNYPNPFNPSTRIDYTIQKRDYVTIVIYNLLGQEVATIIDDVKPAGKHSIIWDGRDYDGTRVASGVYFYRLRVGDITESKKMILLK